jgi:ribokinase
MNPKNVVISGYATLDYVAQLATEFNGTGTVLGNLGVSGAWPRAGGAALYASRRIAAAGLKAFPLTWIGDDGDGGHYLRACQRSQICCEAIDQRRAAKTPRCVLIYNPGGEYGCLLDADLEDHEVVTKSQQMIIGMADHLCVSAGPAKATDAIIEHYPLKRSLSWIAKLDRLSFPDWLCKKLACRAQLIFCNASEREFIEAAHQGARPADQIIIETLGSAGVLIDAPDGRRIISASAIKTYDTTGAGDTLAGEVIAKYLYGQVAIDEAVSFGMAAATDLLASRTANSDIGRT